MKAGSFAAAALLAATAFGQTYVNDATEVTDAFRWSGYSVGQVLFNKYYDDVNKGPYLRWTERHATLLDEDTGIEYLRIDHYLEGNIKSDDMITFELSFTSESDPFFDKKTIAEDSGSCII